MINPLQAFRVFYINWILLKHGLDEVILATHLFRPIRFLRFLSPFYWRRSEKDNYGYRIRRALEDLGPIFIKFGQILSTRRDLLPDEIADELKKLQDQVPPFKGARGYIEKAIGSEIETLFDNFEETPLASASIAQVHAAKLKNGDDVVIKVLRPDIEPVIRRDISLLYLIAKLAQKYWVDGRRLRPVEVVEEFEKTLLAELDLTREAANASMLRRNFTDSPQLYVPDVYWDYCHRNIAVFERIYGTPVGDIDELHRQKISMKQLGEQGVEIFFTQVFRDNFFHADMHPGNIFVAPDGQYIAVDFGIMGSLSTQDQRYLAENFLAFFNRDYHRVAELHVQSEWVPGSTRIEDFEAAIRAVSEPIFEKPISEISFGHFLLKLFQTARQFDMPVQPQLVLLQKTLLNIEGLGRQLYPELDLWTTAKPFLEEWIKTQVGPKAFFEKVKHSLPEATERLPEVPALAYKVLTDASNGQLKIQWEGQTLTQIQKDIQRGQQKTVQAIASGSLMISGIALAGISTTLPITPIITLTASAILGGIGSIGLLVTVFGNKT